MNHNMQMQKETGKILHRKFLSENIGLLLMAPVFLLLMFIVSNLYQLPAEYAFYLTSIFLILWVTTLCMQYRGFGREQSNMKKKAKKSRKAIQKRADNGKNYRKSRTFCIVGTSDQDSDRSFESSFAGRKAGRCSVSSRIV